MDLQSGLLFLSGWAFSFLAHEAGHVGMAYLSGGYLKDGKVDVFNPVMKFKTPDNEKSIMTTLAGPIAQLSTGHFLKKEEDSISKGVFYGSHLHMLIYSIRGTGDFQAFQKETGIERDALRFFFAVHSLSGLVGLHERYKLYAGSGFEWIALGNTESRFYVSLNRNHEKDFLVDFSVGVKPINGLAMGSGWNAERKTAERLVRYSKGRYLYVRAEYRNAGLTLRLENSDTLEFQCPLICRLSERSSQKIFPELSFERSIRSYSIRAVISDRRLDLLAGVSF